MANRRRSFTFSLGPAPNRKGKLGNIANRNIKVSIPAALMERPDLLHELFRMGMEWTNTLPMIFPCSKGKTNARTALADQGARQ